MSVSSLTRSDSTSTGRSPATSPLAMAFSTASASALARLEVRVAFEELLAAAADYRVTSYRERFVSSWARAWKTLPATRT